MKRIISGLLVLLSLVYNFQVLPMRRIIKDEMDDYYSKIFDTPEKYEYFSDASDDGELSSLDEGMTTWVEDTLLQGHFTKFPDEVITDKIIPFCDLETLKSLRLTNKRCKMGCWYCR